MSAEALAVETLGIDTIQAHPNNPRIGNVEVIAESLAANGQYKPIVVQKSTGYVVAGNHTREAAKSLGWEAIQAVVLDLSDEEATRIMLADNRTADRGGYDPKKLYESLESLLDLDGSGYTVDDVETLGDALGTASTVEGPDVDVIKVKEEKAGAKQEGAKVEREQREPMKDIVMLMTQTAAREFGEDVKLMMGELGTENVATTVRLVMKRAADAVRGSA